MNLIVFYIKFYTSIFSEQEYCSIGVVLSLEYKILKPRKRQFNCQLQSSLKLFVISSDTIGKLYIHIVVYTCVYITICICIIYNYIIYKNHVHQCLLMQINN